jgi:hypothetical protein
MCASGRALVAFPLVGGSRVPLEPSGRQLLPFDGHLANPSSKMAPMKSSLSLTLLLFAMSASAFGKDIPDRIVVSGPGLSSPILITDENVRAYFNPEGAQFLASRNDPNAQVFLDRYFLEEPSQKNHGAYEVRFQYETETAGEFRTTQQFLYMPGSPGHIRIDESSIGLLTKPGEYWFRASPKWDELMRPESRGIVEVPAREMTFPRPAPALNNVRIFMPFAWLALGIVIVTAIVVDRRERAQSSLPPRA